MTSRPPNSSQKTKAANQDRESALVKRPLCHVVSRAEQNFVLSAIKMVEIMETVVMVFRDCLWVLLKYVGMDKEWILDG